MDLRVLAIIVFSFDTEELTEVQIEHWMAAAVPAHSKLGAVPSHLKWSEVGTKTT